MGLIIFYIVVNAILFLLCLAKINRMSINFNNIKNTLMQKNQRFQVVRRYKHPSFVQYTSIFNITIKFINVNPCYLTNFELQRLHQRFDHPSIKRLHILLERSGHNVNLSILKYLTKYCYQYRKHEKLPRKFFFTLRNDADFNLHIIVDIIYLAGSLVLDNIDITTRFQVVQ